MIFELPPVALEGTWDQDGVLKDWHCEYHSMKSLDLINPKH